MPTKAATGAVKRGDALERKMLPISQITPAKYNPRRIDAASMNALSKSVDRFGLVQEMVVNQHEDGSFTLISGHQRLWTRAS